MAGPGSGPRGPPSYPGTDARSAGRAADRFLRIAPKIITIRINPDKIRDVIGPGGKVIRAIQAKPTRIEIEDTGWSKSPPPTKPKAKWPWSRSRPSPWSPKGPFTKARWSKPPISAPFVQLAPGTDGLVHISQLANYRVAKVTDVVKEGDIVKVKVLEVSQDGRIRLSLKAPLEEEKTKCPRKPSFLTGSGSSPEKMPHVRSVSMGVWVDVGARDESEAQSGLSHFIEHMIFKGTTRRSAYQIAKEFDAIGGHTNAFTSMENTCYHAKVMDTHLDTMVEILSDIFLNSVFDPPRGRTRTAGHLPGDRHGRRHPRRVCPSSGRRQFLGRPPPGTIDSGKPRKHP
jgi:hypothetical protein